MKILIAVSILNMKHFEQPIILVYGKRDKKKTARSQIAGNVKVNLQYYKDRIILKCIQDQYMTFFHLLCSNSKLPQSNSLAYRLEPFCVAICQQQ